MIPHRPTPILDGQQRDDSYTRGTRTTHITFGQCSQGDGQPDSPGGFPHLLEERRRGHSVVPS